MIYRIGQIGGTPYFTNHGNLTKAAPHLFSCELPDGGHHSDPVSGEAVLGLLPGDHVQGETLKFLFFS